MKKNVTVIAFVAAASGAFAQTSNFEGFSGALNLNSASTNIKLASDGDTFDGVGQQSWNGSVRAAYGFALSPTTVVSIGATYGLGKLKAGSINFGDDGLNLKIKNHLSLYVEPGLLVSDKTLAYGKLSYDSAKAVVTGEDEESKSIKGPGFGFGIRTMIDKTSFVQVEVKQIGFRSVDLQDGTSAKAKASIGTIGFGMKF